MLAIECLEECPVINTPLAQLTELFPDLPSTVVGVSRKGKLFVPHSGDQLLAERSCICCDIEGAGAAHAWPVWTRRN
jgi:Trk K+ transport system NAD-binding subunit